MTSTAPPKRLVQRSCRFAKIRVRRLAKTLGRLTVHRSAATRSTCAAPHRSVRFHGETRARREGALDPWPTIAGRALKKRIRSLGEWARMLALRHCLGGVLLRQ